MPYTMQDFRRDYVKEHLKDLTVEERLRGVPPKTIEKYLQRLKKPTSRNGRTVRNKHVTRPKKRSKPVGD